MEAEPTPTIRHPPRVTRVTGRGRVMIQSRPRRHPLYAALTATADAGGDAGDVQWNFEKFLLTPDGTIADRFRPRTEPESHEVVAAIEAVLPG